MATVSPDSTRISVSRPEAGEGISTSTLSVDTSQTVSSVSTQSPGRFRHSRIVPSATEIPIWGITTSMLVSVGEELTTRLLHVAGLGQDRLLERRAERDRDVRRGETAYRGVEVLERLRRHQRRDLRSHAARLRGLVRDQDLAGLPRAGEDRVSVERAEGAEVEDLDVLVQLGGRLDRQVHRGPVGDHGHLRPLAGDPRLPERHGVLAFGDLAADVAIEPLVLQVADGIGVTDGARQEALGVGRRGRRDDLEAGGLDEPGLGVLRMEGAAGEA